jgi:hypothetical protein
MPAVQTFRHTFDGVATSQAIVIPDMGGTDYDIDGPSVEHASEFVSVRVDPASKTATGFTIYISDAIACTVAGIVIPR